MNDEQGDGTLVQEWLAGDETAFDILYQRHRLRLVRLISGRIGDVHVAEELAQETMLKAVRYADTIDTRRETLWPWLKVTAIRLMADHARTRQQDENSLTSTIREVSTEGRFGGIHDSMLLTVALKDLPREQREALVLFHVGEWTSCEVAQLIGRSTAATRQLLCRARKAMRMRLQELGETARVRVLAPLAGSSKEGVGRLRDRLPMVLGGDQQLETFGGGEGIAQFVISVIVAIGLTGIVDFDSASIPIVGPDSLEDQASFASGVVQHDLAEFADILGFPRRDVPIAPPMKPVHPGPDHRLIGPADIELEVRGESLISNSAVRLGLNVTRPSVEVSTEGTIDVDINVEPDSLTISPNGGPALRSEDRSRMMFTPDLRDDIADGWLED